ncbi:hypothetical protein [Maridesulfovibrio bastinii]|uniref:hypothetical protein n=1 Tax=Maridesulfovibrio bastinii TaxID=47157 RepID=UPI000429D254|nr:hypothetical protein [Maridesulfovibrio bastinii]
MFKRIVIPVLLITLSACAPKNFNGTFTEGQESLPVSMTATAHMLSGTDYSLETELPDGSVFKGEIDTRHPSAILYNTKGKSMKCDFSFKNKKKSFKAGGKAVCTTSEGQSLDLTF